MPPPREEQASIGRISREPPPRSPAIAESKARAQSLIPHVTELEAELSRERKERDTEAALMGEMLVRVAQAESEAKTAEARGIAAESRATALEEASAVAGTRVSELSEHLDSARAAGERLRAEVERLEAELVEARSDAHAASSSSNDEASEQVRAAEARARQEAARALLAEDMIEDLRHAMERGQQALRDAETRAQGHAAELEEKLRAAEDRARWCDEAAKAATESSGLLDARVAELEAKLVEAERATAEATKATAEAEEAATLVSEELTETEKRLEEAEGEIRDGEARVQAAHAQYAKLREDVDGERALMVTLEGQLAQTKDSAGRMKDEYESAMTSLREEHQQLLGQTRTQLEQQIAELETHIAGARRALQDTQKRYEEARDRGNQARALHVAAEERATTLAAASTKASATLADLEKQLTQDQAAFGVRARALAQARELLGAEPSAEPAATSGASKSKPPPKNAPSPKPPPRGKHVKPPVPSMSRQASDEDVLSFDEDELDAMTTPPTRSGS